MFLLSGTMLNDKFWFLDFQLSAVVFFFAHFVNKFLVFICLGVVYALSEYGNTVLISIVIEFNHVKKSRTMSREGFFLCTGTF